MPERPTSYPVDAMRAIDREVAQARDAARIATAAADGAQRLAVQLRIRRNLLVRRAERCTASHVEATWTSTAASKSRRELRHDVGFALWAAGEHIERTEQALLERAAQHEADARSQSRVASAAELRRGEAMVAALSGQSEGSGGAGEPGVEVDRGWVQPPQRQG